MYHSRPSHLTMALVLLCAACLLPLLPTVAQAQVPPTRTDYWINTDDSTVAEVVVLDTATATPPDSGSWSWISLAGIHDLGRNSPGEDESLAKEQGNWWCSDSTQLGKNSVEWGWLTHGWTTDNRKFERSGAGSRRTGSWGRCFAKAVLREDGVFKKKASTDFPFCRQVRAETQNWETPGNETHWWTDSTEHYYGNPLYYYYIVWPGEWH